MLLLGEWQRTVIRVGVVENFGYLGSGKATHGGRYRKMGTLCHCWWEQELPHHFGEQLGESY